MELSTISFSGLILRPFSDSDAENFTSAVIESVESVGKWMPWCSSDYTARNALDWFAACRAERDNGTAFEYGVFCENSGEFLGGAGLNEIRRQHKLCNLGYWIRQLRQRQGVAFRCVQVLSAHAFHELGLHRGEIVVAVGNVASEGVAVKSGALHECVARNRLHIRDKPIAAHIFSLVPKQY